MDRLLISVLFSSFSEALSFLSVATCPSVSSFCLILYVCVCVLVNQLGLHVLQEWPCLGDILWGPEAPACLATRARHSRVPSVGGVFPPIVGGCSYCLGTLVCGPSHSSCWTVVGRVLTQPGRDLTQVQGWVGFIRAHPLMLTGQILLFSHSVASNSSQPNRLQHTRLPCPSLSPGVCSNSRPLSL